MVPLDDRVGDPLRTNREEIEISQFFMETLWSKILVGAGRMSRIG